MYPLLFNKKNDQEKIQILYKRLNKLENLFYNKLDIKNYKYFTCQRCLITCNLLVAYDTEVDDKICYRCTKPNDVTYLK